MRSKTLAALLLTAMTFPLGLPGRAEEGMFLPDTVDKLPLAKMKAKGFMLKPEDVFSNTAPSLKDAIVIIDGGTGEFVSGDGLLLTNHHVAFDGIAALSTPEKDYVANGFTAKTRSEELPAPGYTAQVIVEAKDVTKDILDGVTPQMSGAERAAKVDANRKKVIEAVPKMGGRNATVSEMNSGLIYYLYVTDTYRDVRMVYAPPKNIGFYGGDPDNFEWPRHCGDFTFFRVYADKDNRPADHNKDNVPFKPKKHLTISTAGYKEGDFTMVMGYPGRTNRYRESTSVETNELLQLPFVVSYFNGQIEVLKEASKENRKVALELASDIFGLSNSMKAYEGAIRTLHRSRFLETRKKEEAEFAKFIESTPENKAKYGDVIERLNKLNLEQRKELIKNFLLPRIAPGSSGVLSLVNFAVGRALNAEKPEGQRSPQFSDAAVQRAKGAAATFFAERRPTVERKLLQLHFQLSDAQKPEYRVPFIEGLFEGKTGEAREKAQADLAREIVDSPYYNSPGKLKVLFDLSAAQLRELNDPAINFFLKLAPESQAAQQRTAAYNAEATALRAKYIEGFLASRKGFTSYPDANRTLRFSYGEVKGYTPKDGAVYKYYTTFSGVIEKDRGVEPFDAPQALIDLYNRKDYGRWVDPTFKDVPVDFLSTNDIIGGNSGSAILNGKGEVIGLVFDGNYEGLGNDFVFEAGLGRTISVDIRYILFLAEKMGGAGYLLNELTFAGKAAAATK